MTPGKTDAALTKDGFGRTPATAAASAGDVATFLALMKAGADVTTPDITGNSAAHYLAARGELPALQEMRKAGHGAHIDGDENFHRKTPQDIANAHFKSIAPTHEVPGTPFAPGLQHFQQLQDALQARPKLATGEPKQPTAGPKPVTGGPAP